eukprot:33225_1
MALFLTLVIRLRLALFWIAICTLCCQSSATEIAQKNASHSTASLAHDHGVSISDTIYIRPNFHSKEQPLANASKSDFLFDDRFAVHLVTGERFRFDIMFAEGAKDSHGHSVNEHTMTVLFMIISCVIIAQVLLYWWRTYHRSSFEVVALFGLWFIPIGLAVKSGSVLFVVIWAAYSAVTGVVVRRASRKPLAKKTPRLVYNWFQSVYKACYFAASAGYVVFVLGLLGILIPAVFQSLTISLMFLGLYFGVLVRDCAEMCADRMASTLGYSGGKRGFPRTLLKVNVCAICDEELESVRADVPVPSETVFRLDCDHRFHESCIRGWVMIGKKDTCPQCSEKVTLSRIFHGQFKMYGVMWTRLLGAIRYLIVWNPLILYFAQFLLTYLGYGPDDELPPARIILTPLRY